MKVSVSQQQLAHGLGVVSRAVNPRSTLPVLGNILIATDEGRLRLSATNLELGITCWIPAQITEEGSVTMPARTFTDLISTFPNDTVVMNLDARTQTMTVRCGFNSTDIKGIDAQEFPPIPVPDLSAGVTLNMADFREMIQQVVFAASTDETCPVLQGVMTTIANNEVALAATDGFRISIRKLPLAAPFEKTYNLIIPARALSELARIAVDGDQTLTMNVPPGRGQVIFHLKNTEVVSQLIDGNFPDYRAIIPRSLKTHTVLSRGEFLNACKQAEIIARETDNVIRMEIKTNPDRPGEIKISAQAEQTGSSDVNLDANVDGEGITIAFNVRFLREVLGVVKTPSVVLETNAHNTPAILKPVGDDTFTHVIMPMHLG